MSSLLERAGQKVRRIGAGFGYEGEHPALTGTRCASVHGFSLRANVTVPAHRRDQLERLMCYTARGAVSLERLEADEGGDLLYEIQRVCGEDSVWIYVLLEPQSTPDRWMRFRLLKYCCRIWDLRRFPRIILRPAPDVWAAARWSRRGCVANFDLQAIWCMISLCDPR